ncbi:hypothetical protein IMY05_C4769000200 [Salix suchowensis]|nr:hypothetical protein IMY05_C4769000200 [Salix suchowensis]
MLQSRVGLRPGLDKFVKVRMLDVEILQWGLSRCASVRISRRVEEATNALFTAVPDMSGKLWNRSATTSRRAHARNSRMCIGITSYRGINMVRRNLEVHTRPWFDDRAHERFSATVESAECGSAKPASGTIFSSRPHFPTLTWLQSQGKLVSNVYIPQSRGFDVHAFFVKAKDTHPADHLIVVDSMRVLETRTSCCKVYTPLCTTSPPSFDPTIASDMDASSNVGMDMSGVFGPIYWGEQSILISQR